MHLQDGGNAADEEGDLDERERGDMDEEKREKDKIKTKYLIAAESVQVRLTACFRGLVAQIRFGFGQVRFGVMPHAEGLRPRRGGRGTRRRRERVGSSGDGDGSI